MSEIDNASINSSAVVYASDNHTVRGSLRLIYYIIVLCRVGCEIHVLKSN